MAEDLEQKQKKRKAKGLPSELSLLTDADRAKFELVLEIDSNSKSKGFGKEFLTAQSVRLQPTSADQPEVTFDLKSLTVEQSRKLCANLGIGNCGSQNKFNCRKAIARYFRYQDSLNINGMKPTSHASRLTSNICRAVNVVFGAEFIEDFKTVNDRKTRRDHETQSTYKAFWIRATLAYNSCVACDTVSFQTRTPIAQQDAANDFLTPPSVGISVEGISSNTSNEGNSVRFTDTASTTDDNALQTSADGFSSLICPPDDVYLYDLTLDTEINLLCVNQFDTDAFRKKILDLFKIRRKMKENMTVSGTHDSDPWNFVECAMSGTSGFTKIGVYYFYQRCEANSDIDSYFQPFLDPSMRGDTVSLLDDDEGMDDFVTTSSSLNSSRSNKKRVKREHELETDAMLQSVFQQGGTILKHLADAAEERKAAALDLRKKTSFHARLEVAKALGDREELQKLMEEAKAMER
jgi:hypothetical protein